jgi:hypothetical protein
MALDDRHPSTPFKFKLPAFANTAAGREARRTSWAAATDSAPGKSQLGTLESAHKSDEVSEPMAVRFSLILPIRPSKFSAAVQAALVDTIALASHMPPESVQIERANEVHRISQQKSGTTIEGKVKIKVRSGLNMMGLPWVALS